VIRRACSQLFRKELLEMDERFKKAIVAGSLAAFAAEAADIGHVSWVHALPSALQLATMASTTSSISAVFVADFGSASTEAVYPNVPDSKPLKNDGQVQLPSSKAGPKA
jgi:hypothetical protein